MLMCRVSDKLILIHFDRFSGVVPNSVTVLNYVSMGALILIPIGYTLFGYTLF